MYNNYGNYLTAYGTVDNLLVLIFSSKWYKRLFLKVVSFMLQSQFPSSQVQY